MKNNIYKIVDKDNEIYVDCFIALDDELAKQKVQSQLKKNKYVFDNTQNINDKANINAYFNNAKNYQLLNQDDKIIFNFSELIQLKEKKE